MYCKLHLCAVARILSNKGSLEVNSCVLQKRTAQNKLVSS